MRKPLLTTGMFLLIGGHSIMSEAVTDPALLQKMLDQSAILEAKKNECSQLNGSDPHPIHGLHCPRVWDGAMCWPYVKAGTVANLSCPDYVTGFNPKGFAVRSCLGDGNWFYREDKNSTWTNYTDCAPQKYIETMVPVEGNEFNNTLLQSYIPVIKEIGRVGYSVSLATLVIAFTILAAIKKLRCPRNSLHMHLFASFILRAFMALLKDNLFVDGLGLRSVIDDEGNFIYKNEHNNWECKLVVVLWQFFLMANYCWILMEGLYLHNLIFFALFSDNNGICLYVVLGWGFPLLFILAWVPTRVTYENVLCWTTNLNSNIFWIIRGPIAVSIVINFIFFINISRLLFVKLTSSQVSDSRNARYRKLAKSTLVLVPLFGIHYMTMLLMPEFAKDNETIEIAWLFTDIFFGSFQGCFVAILYCFLNGEVQTELKKKWHHYMDNSQVDNGHSAVLNQSLNFFTRIRKTNFRERHKPSRCTTDIPSPSVTQKDCNTNTTCFNNHSVPASPRAEKSSDNYSWNCPMHVPTHDNSLTVSVPCKSPVGTESKVTGADVESQEVESSTALTPMLNGKPNCQRSLPKREKLELLYLERMESVDQGETTV